MLPSSTSTPETLRGPERRSSHGKRSMDEPKKHQEIEKRHTVSLLNWVLIVSNLFLILILLMRYIFAPMCCTNFRTGIGNADIRIMFGAGKDDTGGGKTLENWVMHSGSGGSNHATENLNTAAEVETTEVPLTSLQPPHPPADTVKGYNPSLDMPRPTNIYDYLRVFQVVFIVDDSSSMEGARWSETRDALATVAEKAFELKVDTVSLRFLNNAHHVRGFQGKETLRSLFNTVTPRGLTPLGKTLKAVFDEHLNRIDTAVREGEDSYSKIPPLSIIVLTDGVPTDKGEDEPAKVIANAVKRLNDNHYHPNTMNVQIVQIANERDATKALKSLVLGDNRMIVDTVPYRGILDSEKLQRILLGGLHPNARSQLPAATLANN